VIGVVEVLFICSSGDGTSMDYRGVKVRARGIEIGVAGILREIPPKYPPKIYYGANILFPHESPFA